MNDAPGYVETRLASFPIRPEVAIRAYPRSELADIADRLRRGLRVPFTIAQIDAEIARRAEIERRPRDERHA